MVGFFCNDRSPENTKVNIIQHNENFIVIDKERPSNSRTFPGMKNNRDNENSSEPNIKTRSDRTSHMFLHHHHRQFHPKLSTVRVSEEAPSVHHCENFAFPPPPPPNPKRSGPRRESFSLIFSDILFCTDWFNAVTLMHLYNGLI